MDPSLPPRHEGGAIHGGGGFKSPEKKVKAPGSPTMSTPSREERDDEEDDFNTPINLTTLARWGSERTDISKFRREIFDRCLPTDDYLLTASRPPFLPRDLISYSPPWNKTNLGRELGNMCASDIEADTPTASPLKGPWGTPTRRSCLSSQPSHHDYM